MISRPCLLELINIEENLSPTMEEELLNELYKRERRSKNLILFNLEESASQTDDLQSNDVAKVRELLNSILPASWIDLKVTR